MVLISSFAESISLGSTRMVLRISAVCAMISLILTGTVVCQQETAEQFVERVKKAIQNDEWGRAKSGITHALNLKPESPEANLIAARVYWHEGSRSQATDFLVKAVTLQPNFPAAHFLLAQYLKEQNKLDEARDEVTVAINQGVSLFSAYCLLSEIYIAKSDFASATSSLESAIRFSTEEQTEEASKIREKIAQAQDLFERLKQFSEIEAGQKGPEVTPPKLLNAPNPGYTEEARALKIQGQVLMFLLISATGDVESVMVLRFLGHGLDERAIEAARKIKFSPATRSGQPISYWKRVSIEFYLR